MELKQMIYPLVGATLMTMAVMTTGCVKKHTHADLSDAEIELLHKQAIANNDSVIKVYEGKVAEDSTAMLKAQQAMNGINLQKLEKKYYQASQLREEARRQLEAVEKDGKENIINVQKAKYNEVMNKTQQHVDEYNNALNVSNIADGKVYNASKAKLNYLKEQQQYRMEMPQYTSKMQLSDDKNHVSEIGALRWLDRDPESGELLDDSYLGYNKDYVFGKIF